MKTIKNVTISKQEKPSSAWKRLLDKATDYTRLKAGTAVLAAAIAASAPAFVSCEGKTDLSQYENQDAIESPDADYSGSCTPNTRAYYKAMVSISGEERLLNENDQVRINGRDYRVSFTQEGDAVFTDKAGNEVVIQDEGVVNNSPVQITDRSVDLAVYSSRALIKISDGESQEFAIMPGNSTVSRSINGALIGIELKDIESWDMMGVYVPAAITFSLDGEVLGTAGTLIPEGTLATGSSKRTVTVSAVEFMVEQFPEEGVNACEQTVARAYVMVDNSDSIHPLNEGEQMELSNGSPFAVEKVFPGLTEGAVQVEISWREKGVQKYATLAPGESATIENSSGVSTVTVAGASFQTEE